MLRGPGLAALLLASASLSWGGSVYVSHDVNQNGYFGTIDLTTGQYTAISTNAPGSVSPGIFNGFNFNNGTLYGNAQTNSQTQTLWTLNQPTPGFVCTVGTSACNILGTTPNPYVGGSGGMPNGAFYGLAQVGNNEHLFIQNYSTGVGTEIGDTGLGFNFFYANTAMAGDGTNLFLTASQHFGINFDKLYGINTSTGAATEIANVTGLGSGQRIWSMFFDTGTMYAFVSEYGGQNLKLETLNTSTGALTLVLDLGSPGLGDITAAAVNPGSDTPEPATFGLIGGGLAGLIALRRRRNARQ